MINLSLNMVSAGQVTVRFPLPQNKNNAKITLTVSQNLLQNDRESPVLTTCAVRNQLQGLQQKKASPPFISNGKP